MRRRTLLGGSSIIEYVFSAQTTSFSVYYYSSSSNVNIQSTLNGTNVGYSVVSYDGTVVTGATTAATYVTIYYSENLEYSRRNGNVVLKQNDSNKTITINVLQYERTLDLGYEGILLDGTSGSYGGINCGNASFSNVPSWARVTYSSGKLNVTASSTNSASTARLATITVSGGSQSDTLTIIQLPSDYHSRSYVSIGGKNWAIKNVGASSVKDYGNYYQWGAGAVTYKNEVQYHTGGTDTSYTLPSTADTATVVMGSSWRMPTQSEYVSLTSTSYYWVSYNGVNGVVFNSSGNVLFFPAAGNYHNGGLWNETSYVDFWSSTSYSSRDACYLYFNTATKGVSHYYRYWGFSVRGVQA